MTEETLLRKNERCIKLVLLALFLMNQHLIQITVCVPSEVYEYACSKHEKTGQTIEQQVRMALELLQTVEMLMNGVATSGF